jgi:multiple antibiotic resistance protein
LAAFELALVTVSSIIAVMEPFSTIAVYATITKRFDSAKKDKIISRSMLLSLVVLVFFALTGHLLFNIFQITIASFQIAGGILLVAVALQMLDVGKPDELDERGKNVAIVPLAFPLTAGPGPITAVILLMSRSGGILDSVFVFVGILAGIAIIYVGMKYSSRLFKLLGDDGLRVVTALMAIIVLAIAVQFIIEGIADVIPQITG